MSSSKTTSIQEREEGLSMIAASILAGHLSYEKFLSICVDSEARAFVDDWLRGNLVEENNGKIIPGFNDRPGDESGE